MNVPREPVCLTHGMIIGTLLFWAASELVLPEAMTASQAAVCLAGGSLAILVLRTATRRLARKAFGAERTLIVGNRGTSNLVSKIRAHPEYRILPVGIIDDRPTEQPRVALDRCPATPPNPSAGPQPAGRE